MPSTSASVYALHHTLPMGYVVSPFISPARFQNTVDMVFQDLQESMDGNQWIIVVGLSPALIRRLADAEHPLENLNYRFQWDGVIGLVKVIASYFHILATTQLVGAIDSQLSAMLNATTHIRWGANTAHEPTAHNGKQPDEAFFPPSRWAPVSQTWSCPTLIIETGVPQSLSRLREDAKWWFASTNGNVRIVLILIFSGSTLHIEKWQLAPPNGPRPLGREDINALRLQNPPMPPLVPQLPATQQAYAAQEIEVTWSHAAGAPLVLPFAALFDQQPGPGQHNIVLEAQDLCSVAGCLL
ncbi:hypothetical protein N7452_008058 [Penicillium brevicompactum]|uniref:Uncharacterized protein n=1 Tax=Penicillium brevicompactum TaxID=5074 RepID=A0A9W9Q956_PENBR|nr:hypothetical protein N7452_008058 [Penicillium brevicompactum]